jgi:hypothetical protein
MGKAVQGVIEIAVGAVLVINAWFPGAAFLGKLFIAYGLGQLATALTGTPSRNTAPVPWQFMVNGSTYPRTIIYGTTRVSGVIVYERLKLIGSGGRPPGPGSAVP